MNVTVERYDNYKSFAIVNDSVQGTIHGEFRLLQEDGTHLDVKMHLQSKELIRLGDCAQTALFTITFNDTLMTELRGKVDTFSNELSIMVQFQYLGNRNEQSDIAYIHVSLDNFSETTSGVNPMSTESKNSTESTDLCNGNNVTEISGGLSLYSIYSYLITCFVFILLCCY